jgi:hypothetical protein
MRRLSARVLAGVLAATVVAIGCGDDTVDDQVGAADGLDRQTVTVDRVEIEVTPLRLDGSAAEFEVVLDTHIVALDLDVAAGAALQVGGVSWGPGLWDGDDPGGHHRTGTLRFDGRSDVTGPVDLIIEGLDSPATFRWLEEPAATGS